MCTVMCCTFCVIVHFCIWSNRYARKIPKLHSRNRSIIYWKCDLFSGWDPAAIHLCQNHELTTSVFTDRIRRHEDLLPNNQNMTKFKKRTSHGLYFSMNHWSGHGLFTLLTVLLQHTSGSPALSEDFLSSRFSHVPFANKDAAKEQI